MNLADMFYNAIKVRELMSLGTARVDSAAKMWN